MVGGLPHDPSESQVPSGYGSVIPWDLKSTLLDPVQLVDRWLSEGRVVRDVEDPTGGFEWAVPGNSIYHFHPGALARTESYAHI